MGATLVKKESQDIRSQSDRSVSCIRIFLCVSDSVCVVNRMGATPRTNALSTCWDDWGDTQYALAWRSPRK